jgi:two-component system sensor histidine kinase/response regulator
MPPLLSHRVLVVDDEPSILNVLEMALTAAGAQVVTATDGPTALAIVATQPPDLILLDLKMPGMDGFKVLEHLGAAARTARIPVAIETSAEDYASLARARREGAAAFISKPFRLPELIETCRRILGGSRPLQGQTANEEKSVPVQVRDPTGKVLRIGFLLGLDERGAQLDLSGPIPLTQSVLLTLFEDGAERSLPGEVRWVTSLGGRYQLGLSLRGTPGLANHS